MGTAVLPFLAVHFHVCLQCVVAVQLGVAMRASILSVQVFLCHVQREPTEHIVLAAARLLRAGELVDVQDHVLFGFVWRSAKLFTHAALIIAFLVALFIQELVVGARLVFHQTVGGVTFWRCKYKNKYC